MKFPSIIQAALDIVQPPRVPDPGTFHLDIKRPGVPPCQCLEHTHLRYQQERKEELRREDMAHDVFMYRG